MKKICLAIIALVTANIAFAQIVNNVSRSKITFEIKNLGIKTGGGIDSIKASVLFDPASLNAGKIEAVADVTTLNTENNMRDKHLKGDNYFDVAQYPKIVMSSVGFKHKSGSNYIGRFNLTIKDKTKMIDLPFTYTETGNGKLFKSSFKINRRDFGVGGGSLTLANEVTVFIEAETGK